MNLDLTITPRKPVVEVGDVPFGKSETNVLTRGCEIFNDPSILSSALGQLLPTRQDSGKHPPT